MSKWIIKLFGINKLNFFGWLFSGLLTVAIVLACIVMAIVRINSLEDLDTQLFLLFGILFVLFGQFCLSLQCYHAKLAEKLDNEKSGSKEGSENK